MSIYAFHLYAISNFASYVFLERATDGIEITHDPETNTVNCTAYGLFPKPDMEFEVTAR